MRRRQIKYRNALTELWNDGHSVQSIAHFMGLSETAVKERLDSARQGFGSPREMLEAAEAKAERAATKKAKGRK